MPTGGDVERALFLNRLHQPLPAGYRRLYFGAEFCPWRFPAVDEVREALAVAHAAGWSFTLATPVLAERLRPRLRQTLAAILPLLTSDDEVLISDWGALAPLRELAPQRAPVLGRVLSGQKRGPQILDLDLTPEQLDYFRQGNWYAAEAVALLREERIVRVELDNLPQGLAPLPAGLRGTLHTPYAMVTSSRNCPFRDGPADGGCAASCGEVFTLTSPRSPLPLYQGGNTQFLLLPDLPDAPKSLGIDRIVHHPGLPC